ncbi:hypothetical protein FB451DRAFT_1519843 [Mycena latifolia]|nr:hypothetical protein FB451DRAFT_1519843 [Mycena latifolia]
MHLLHVIAGALQKFQSLWTAASIIYVIISSRSPFSHEQWGNISADSSSLKLESHHGRDRTGDHVGAPGGKVLQACTCNWERKESHDPIRAMEPRDHHKGSNARTIQRLGGAFIIKDPIPNPRVMMPGIDGCLRLRYVAELSVHTGPCERTSGQQQGRGLYEGGKQDKETTGARASVESMMREFETLTDERMRIASTRMNDGFVGERERLPRDNLDIQKRRKLRCERVPEERWLDATANGHRGSLLVPMASSGDLPEMRESRSGGRAQWWQS